MQQSTGLGFILFAFQLIADAIFQDNICTLPCGTGLSSYELTWSGFSASGAKLSKTEHEASKLSNMVVDFAGWTDVNSISAYLAHLGQEVNDEARQRLAMLVPSKAVLRLFRDLRDRFRPIISTIEDTIEADNPMTWEECIHEREDRLTTAFIPTTNGEQRCLEGNLCGELRRMFRQVRQGQDNVAFAEFRSVEATLKLVIATFITHGGHMAFKGQLPKLVETAFARIKIIDGDFYTTTDEPFAFRVADNYFQMTDSVYFSIDSHVNHRLHINNNSERDDDLVPPFFYPVEQPSGPDIVFVVRFSGVALDVTAGSTLTPSLGSTPFDIICPVFVQVKFCKELSEVKAIDARGTVQPIKIKKLGVKLSQLCRPHGHYISLVVS
ncbi:hypothetical protein BGZ51_009272 [Haplosporangium sp. Z 767]|nr:hypothetical protein BGZ50_008090 [Haplosporangium sp. Z 11]KAF9189805.1 hypothetical protein BGZ51_009272 [Haplosporangium sp. Z 767]